MNTAAELAFRLALEGCVQHLRKACRAQKSTLSVDYVHSWARPRGLVHVQLTVRLPKEKP